MRIVVAGTGRLGASVMAALVDAERPVVALLQSSRGLSARERTWRRVMSRIANPDVDALALAHRQGIPVMWLEDQGVAELDAVRALRPDLILCCGFGLIFKPELLDIPTIGCVNVHSSLLPKHRGPSPFAHVILSGETETGVTFHTMTQHIDDGAMLYRARCPIEPTDTSATIYAYCCSLAYAHTADVVDAIEAEGVQGAPQDSALATYEPRMTHEAAAIDWSQPASEIERLVRASVVYYPAWFVHRGRVVRVLRATYDPRPVSEPAGTVLELRPYPVVATGEGRLIIHQAYAERRWLNAWPAPWAPLRSSEIL